MRETEFVDALVADLQPVRPAVSWARAIAIWTLASSLFVVSAILAGGPPRAGLGEDLRSLRLLVEIALGVATVFAVIAAGLEVGVPGSPSPLRLIAPAALLGACWIGLTLAGEALPGPAYSMIGKRPHCALEALAFSLPPTGLAFALLRRRLMGAQRAAGALAGIAAAALLAIGMQLACLYEPGHALRFHFSPILVLAISGAAAGHFFLPRD